MLQTRAELIDTHLYLQTKYREVREQFLTRHQQFTKLRQRFYLIECAWCKTRLGWKRKTGAVSGDTSHGICPQCAMDILREVVQLRLPPLVLITL